MLHYNNCGDLPETRRVLLLTLETVFLVGEDLHKPDLVVLAAFLSMFWESHGFMFL